MARRFSRLSRLRPVVGAVVLLSCGALLAAQSADRAALDALARRAGERLQALQREADALATRERTLLGDLRQLEIDREMKTAQLAQVDADVARTAAQLAETTTALSTLQARADVDAPALRARMVELYKLGHGRYLRLFLSATDLGQVGEAARMVATLARADRDRFTAYQRRVAELQARKTELAERTKQLQAAQSTAQKARAEALKATAAQQALVKDIDARRDLNAQLTSELAAAQARLQVAVRELGGGGGGTAVALPLRPFRGDLPWPVEGAVQRRFGNGARGASSNGIDVAAPEGVPVRAVHDGTVAYADVFAGFGRLVIVDHGGQAFSLYGQLLDTDVKPGTRLTRGQPLGTVGTMPGGTSGLYFELRVDGQPVDPLQWLRKK